METDWKLLDRHVLGVIRLKLSKNVAHNVVNQKTIIGMMKALSDMYEKPLANNKVHLMKKLFDLQMGEGAAIVTHLNEFNTIVNQLSSVEIDFEDEVRALILLALLPNSWELLRAAVCNSVGTAKLKFNDVRYRILAEEVCRIDSCESSTRNKGKSKSKNGRSKSRTKQSFECWNCEKPGHIKRNCKASTEMEEKRGGVTVTTEDIESAIDSLVQERLFTSMPGLV